MVRVYLCRVPTCALTCRHNPSPFEFAHMWYAFAGKRILIVGAGIGGPAFAVGLQRLCSEQGITPAPTVCLFERDESTAISSGRGYSLSVRSDSGGLQVGVFCWLGR